MYWKKPRASTVLFSLFFQLPVSCSKLQKRLYFWKASERKGNFQSHALTKFQIFRDTSYSIAVDCLGIVLIKFKCIPGCFHLFIIQQHMWNVSPLSHLIRCFGVLVSSISVCLLPCPVASAITFRLKQKVMAGVGASASKYPVGGTAPRSSRKQWRTWQKYVDFAEQGRVVCSKTKRMEILMRCRKLSLVFL